MTKAQLKYFQGLGSIKNRKLEQKYLVEGHKNVLEWLEDGRTVDTLIATKEWLGENDKFIHNFSGSIIEAEQFEIDKISTLHTPTPVVLVAKFANIELLPNWSDKWILALDGIRDPGNMGTIIRTAEWFGIETIFLSKDCVEVYNPKVVQATMGSLLRVHVQECIDLPDTLTQLNKPIYITHLNGSNIHDLNTVTPGIIVIGNESNGVTNEVLGTATQTVFIPRLGKAESLNAAVATGIVCYSLIMQQKIK